MTTATGRPYQEPPAEYEVTSTRNVFVSMRDGVKLATDVYRPALRAEPLPGRWPVLLSRTVYGKHRSRWGKRFAGHGYVVVVQDVRGRFESEGDFYPYATEGRDGFDTVEWAATQPWSNGSVGTFGRSYLGVAQLALALERPPHLRAMLVSATPANYYEDAFARGGAYCLLHNVAYALHLASTSKEAAADAATQRALEEAAGPDLRRWLDAYPQWDPNPLAAVPAYDRWFQDWTDHPDLDEYWQQPSYLFDRSYARFPDIPIYIVGGWYDIFLRGTLANFAGLLPIHESPTKLLIGPWVHAMGTRHAGDVDFGPAAAVDLEVETLRWFEQVLKGKDTGILAEPPVQIFHMGGGAGNGDDEGRLAHGGEWRSHRAWPPEDAVPRRFYLHADGSLSERLPSTSPPTRFVADPADPVPTVGGGIDVGRDRFPDGPRDQRCGSTPLAARPDVVVFQTPVLDRDLEVSGPVTVTLWVASSAPDFDLAAKLIDVHPPSPTYPDGFAMNLTDRIVRVRHRAGIPRAEVITRGETHEVTIDLLATSNRFARGHRIRLDLAGSNYPFFDVNPKIKVETLIHHDPQRPSHLVLPIVGATA